MNKVLLLVFILNITGGVVSAQINSNKFMDRTTGVETVPVMLLKSDQKKGDFKIGLQSRAIGMASRSNQDNKFNYVMLFPPDFKQGKSASALRLHDIELGFNYKFHDNIGFFTRLRYNPDRVFGGSLRRTVIDKDGKTTTVELGSAADSLKLTGMVREGYLYFGDLNESPVYSMLGTFRAPFGVMKTYSPFTLSMVWHYIQVEGSGGTIGYHNDRIHATVTALQTGPQLRSANQGEDGGVGNIIVDLKYQLLENLRVGGGYITGTNYCDKAFPTLHFKKCEGEDNPGIIANAEYSISKDTAVQFEFFTTLKPWEATQQPADLLTKKTLEHFKPTKVSAFLVEFKKDFADKHRISLSYSKGIQGPSGSPWEFNEQTVLGYRNTHSDSVTFFSELIFTRGFVPFQPIGGQFVNTGAPTPTYIPVSDRDTKQYTGVIGIKVTL